MPRTVGFALALTFLAGATVAPRAADRPELVGMYISRGVNPDGSEYQGLVHIARNNDSFVVSWISPRMVDGVVRPQPVSAGIGIASGGKLAVSYYGATLVGIVVYTIEDGGKRLAGEWAVAGDDGTVYSETLTRLPSTPVDPSTAEPQEPQNRPEPRRPRELQRPPSDRERDVTPAGWNWL